VIAGRVSLLAAEAASIMEKNVTRTIEKSLQTYSLKVPAHMAATRMKPDRDSHDE
jgi:hypothetical protein